MICEHHNHARLISYITIPLGLGWNSSYKGKHMININKIKTKMD